MSQPLLPPESPRSGPLFGSVSHLNKTSATEFIENCGVEVYLPNPHLQSPESFLGSNSKMPCPARLERGLALARRRRQILLPDCRFGQSRTKQVSRFHPQARILRPVLG